MAEGAIRAALGPLEERAAATGTELDRISVRDLVLALEIGAFQAERGVPQRVRFNVVVEHAPLPAAQDDDVDKVLSYDMIVEAIEGVLAEERFNLLETVAERIAARILLDPRAERVFIRIEKLDRVPGALGIEIMRSRLPRDGRIAPLAARPSDPLARPHPFVVFLPRRTLAGPDLRRWIDAIADLGRPTVICVDAPGLPLPGAGQPLADRRIALLAIEQMAWKLAGQDRRCVVVDSRTEIDWAMKHGQISVWAPSKIVLDARDKPASVAPVDLARWFSERFEAEALVIAGGGSSVPGAEVIARPGELTERFAADVDGAREDRRRGGSFGRAE